MGSLLSICAEVASKQLTRPPPALVRQQHRLSLGLWVGDVASLVQPVQRIPIVALPRPPIALDSEPQQRQNHLIHLLAVVVADRTVSLRMGHRSPSIECT